MPNLSRRLTEPLFINESDLYAREQRRGILGRANVSGYTASVDETDDRPWETALGTRTRPGIVAANKRKHLGKKIRIGDKVYSIEDMMGPRFRDDLDRFDIVFSTKDEARKFGRRNLDFEILP